jgi:hypothetical protein
MFNQFGEPISYVPDAGGGDPIPTSCILLKERVTQSASPGFFCDVQVDPLVITRPQRGDQVQWADDTIYVVAQIIAPPYSLTTLALHRKFDP